MGNPNFIHGPLNRLLASVVWNGFAKLNVVPQFLLPEAIDINPNGPATTNLPGLTGVIPSGEPYIPVEMTLHIVRTSPLANLYKSQMEQDSFLGQCTVRPDTSKLDPMTFVNMSILRVNSFSMSGRDAGYVVTVGGAYQVNQGLWT